LFSGVSALSDGVTFFSESCELSCDFKPRIAKEDEGEGTFLAALLLLSLLTSFPTRL